MLPSLGHRTICRIHNQNRTVHLLTPHLIESYFGIAEKALAIAIVDEDSKPIIQNFKVILGSNINPQSHKDKLILNGGRILPTKI